MRPPKGVSIQSVSNGKIPPGQSHLSDSNVGGRVLTPRRMQWVRMWVAPKRLGCLPQPALSDDRASVQPLLHNHTTRLLGQPSGPGVVDIPEKSRRPGSFV